MCAGEKAAAVATPMVQRRVWRGAIALLSSIDNDCDCYSLLFFATALSGYLSICFFDSFDVIDLIVACIRLLRFLVADTWKLERKKRGSPLLNRQTKILFSPLFSLSSSPPAYCSFCFYVSPIDALHALTLMLMKASSAIGVWWLLFIDRHN